MVCGFTLSPGSTGWTLVYLGRMPDPVILSPLFPFPVGATEEFCSP